MQPSRLRAHAVGSGDFVAVGEHLFHLATGAGALQPHERVLDVACGVGRLAVPLTRYLTTGTYAGFDVSRRAIEWCRREITSRHPNFVFETVDVYNEHYNPRGKIAPVDFVFPCAEQSVDLVFLASILTHLRPEAAARYIAETARVLKPGGRAVMTMFLLDDAAREKVRDGVADKPFHTFPESWWAVQDPEDVEAAIAFDIDVVMEALRSRGLRSRLLSRGAWSVNPDPLTYQDLIVAESE